MTTPPDPQPAPDTGLDQRVSQLETGQQSILAKLDQLLTGPADPPEPERPEVNIADEIRRQLAEARTREPKPKAEPARQEPEQPPKAPVRRVTKLMWGGDD